MVYGVSSLQTLPISGYAASASSRISIPVSPASYIYSHFEHVSGVPAPDGAAGVSITKLKVLDVLIDRLAQLKKQGDGAAGHTGPMSEERIDALIEKYEGELKAAHAANAAMPYNPRPSAQTGVLFNLVA